MLRIMEVRLLQKQREERNMIVMLFITVGHENKLTPEHSTFRVSYCVEYRS